MHILIIESRLFATADDWEYFLHQLCIDTDSKAIKSITIDMILNEHVSINYY